MTLVRQAAGHPGGDTNSPDLLARLLTLGRPLVMGVLNVTPDSFSDGGYFFDPAAALSQARRMVADGADILDIGAESTRPYGGVVAVPSAEEIGRLARVLPAAVGLGVPVSIDTMKASVAEWALAAGAVVVNDVWGLQRDSELARVVAQRAVPVIITHNREAADPSIDIMTDIAAFFSRSLDIAACAGIARQKIVLHRDRTHRRTQIVWAPASRRRVAQTLHRQGFARPTRSAAGRIDRRPCARGVGRGSDNPHS